MIFPRASYVHNPGLSLLCKREHVRPVLCGNYTIASKQRTACKCHEDNRHMGRISGQKLVLNYRLFSFFTPGLLVHSSLYTLARTSLSRPCVHRVVPYPRYIFFFNLTCSRWTSALPSCPWSLRIFPSLPGSRLTNFYRDASSALLQLVTQWLHFYLFTFPRFPLRKKEHKSYQYGKNRSHDFCTSKCAGYLLEHSVEEG